MYIVFYNDPNIVIKGIVETLEDAKKILEKEALDYIIYEEGIKKSLVAYQEEIVKEGLFLRKECDVQNAGEEKGCMDWNTIGVYRKTMYVSVGWFYNGQEKKTAISLVRKYSIIMYDMPTGGGTGKETEGEKRRSTSSMKPDVIAELVKRLKDKGGDGDRLQRDTSGGDRLQRDTFGGDRRGGGGSVVERATPL